MAESADAADSKSAEVHPSWGFNSPSRHHIQNLTVSAASTGQPFAIFQETSILRNPEQKCLHQGSKDHIKCDLSHMRVVACA